MSQRSGSRGLCGWGNGYWCRGPRTMVLVAGLLDARWKVEIEAEAIVGSRPLV